jgi:hypothetical protein
MWKITMWEIRLTWIMVTIGLGALPSHANNRFVFKLKDAVGVLYTVSIAAADEQVEIIGEDEAYCAYWKGERRAWGRYGIMLQRANWKRAKLQALALAGSRDQPIEFNLNRRMVYVLPARTKEQLDLYDLAT